jgi:predicted ATPase
MLLVLDNVEHLPGVALLVSEMLATSPELTILATGRAPLHVRGEHQFPVPSLQLPHLAQLPDLDKLRQYAAVALFVARAQAVQPAFQMTAVNAPIVATICARLDGLPLALELAAARLKLFPPEALLARLSNRLSLLTGGPHDLPARQQTIRAAIAWSYDLLDEAEQALFRRLGVFVGGFTLEAAEAVCGTEVVDDLSALVDKSLVHPAATGEEPRYTMLETIREYTLEQLELSGEAAAVRRQHAAYYLSLVEAAEEPLRAASPPHLARLETEYDNVRAALIWARGSDDAEVFVRLAGALGLFWTLQGYHSEALVWLKHAVARSNTVGTAIRAKALYQAGWFANSNYDPFADSAQGSRWLEQSLALYQELEHLQGMADLMAALGWSAWDGPSDTRLEASLPLYRKIGDHHAAARVLLQLGALARMQCDYIRAGALLDEGLALSRNLANTSHITFGSLQLGHVARALGDDARAAACYDEACRLAQAGGYKDDLASIYHNQAYLALHQGQPGRAEALLVESIVLSRTVGHWTQVVYGLEVMGGVAVAQGQPERAVRLLGAGEAYLARTKQSFGQPERGEHDSYIAAARTQLGKEAFATAWAEGQAMTLEEAVAYALAPS